MTGTGARIVKAIEAAWADIRTVNPEVPDVVVVTGSGWHQKGGDRWAHFWANRWVDLGDEGEDTADAPRKPELFVAGQLLGLSGRRIMQTLLHEAAHGLCHVRGIKDTNVNGRHNLRFVAAAKELGDEWPEGGEAHKTHGYSAVVITDAAAEKYADTITALESAVKAYLSEVVTVTGTGGGDEGGSGGGDEGGAGTGTGGRKVNKRPNAVCGCEEPEPFPVSPGRLAKRAILCGECGEKFYHPEVSSQAA
ncbi:MAG: hypothetical protein ABIQ18_39785 [Umezawaea sp.]